MTESLAQLVALHHWLHAHPERSSQGSNMAQHLRWLLADHAPPNAVIALSGAGFAAVYDGAELGRTTMFRAELDALPIHDTNDLPNCSRKAYPFCSGGTTC